MPSADLPEIDESTLGEVVGIALDDPGARVVDWQAGALGAVLVAWTTEGIYRITGTATTATGRSDWSLVLKVLARRDFTWLSEALGPEYADSFDPLTFWATERDALCSDLLAQPTGRFVPVRCYAAHERGDTIQLWLEDIREPPGTVWDLPRHALAARHLGQFNGSHAGAATAAYPWLHSNAVRSMLTNSSRSWPLIDETDWHAPRVARVFPTPLADRLARVVGARERLLTCLAEQPQSLAHQDPGRRNMLSRLSPSGEVETVAVDWGAAGVAAIGEDLGNQVLGNLFFLDVDPSHAHEYREAALDAYLAGLRDAGCQVDPSLVRQAALAHGLKYVGMTHAWIHQRADGEAVPGLLTRGDASFGLADETWVRWGEAVYAVLDAVEEAVAGLDEG